MSKPEKTIIFSTFIMLAAYIVVFNLNVPYYWGYGEKLIPPMMLDILWKIGSVMSILTLMVCIKDSGQRNLENRGGWIVYMLVLGAVGVPHYYIRHGRRPRS